MPETHIYLPLRTPAQRRLIATTSRDAKMIEKNNIAILESTPGAGPLGEGKTLYHVSPNRSKYPDGLFPGGTGGFSTYSEAEARSYFKRMTTRLSKDADIQGRVDHDERGGKAKDAKHPEYVNRLIELLKRDRPRATRELETYASTLRTKADKMRGQGSSNSDIRELQERAGDIERLLRGTGDAGRVSIRGYGAWESKLMREYGDMVAISGSAFSGKKDTSVATLRGGKVVGEMKDHPETGWYLTKDAHEGLGARYASMGWTEQQLRNTLSSQGGTAQEIEREVASFKKELEVVKKLRRSTRGQRRQDASLKDSNIQPGMPQVDAGLATKCTRCGHVEPANPLNKSLKEGQTFKMFCGLQGRGNCRANTQHQIIKLGSKDAASYPGGTPETSSFQLDPNSKKTYKVGDPFTHGGKAGTVVKKYVSPSGVTYVTIKWKDAEVSPETRALIGEYNTLRQKFNEMYDKLDALERRSNQGYPSKQLEQIRIQNEMRKIRPRIAELAKILYPQGGRSAQDAVGKYRKGQVVWMRSTGEKGKIADGPRSGGRGVWYDLDLDSGYQQDDVIESDLTTSPPPRAKQKDAHSHHVDKSQWMAEVKRRYPKAEWDEKMFSTSVRENNVLVAYWSGSTGTIKEKTKDAITLTPAEKQRMKTEWANLASQSLAGLKEIYKQSHRVSDPSGMTRTDLVSAIMFARHGETRMKQAFSDATNHLGEKEYTTYYAWRAAAKAAGATRFEGDKDIAHAINAQGKHVGEWYGDKGSIYKTTDSANFYEDTEKVVKRDGPYEIREWPEPRAKTVRPFSVWVNGRIMIQNISSMASAERELTRLKEAYGMRPQHNSVGGLNPGSRGRADELVSVEYRGFMINEKSTGQLAVVSKSGDVLGFERTVQAAKELIDAHRRSSSNIRGRDAAGDPRWRVSCRMVDPLKPQHPSMNSVIRSVGLTAPDESAAKARAVEYYKKKGYKRVDPYLCEPSTPDRAMDSIAKDPEGTKIEVGNWKEGERYYTPKLNKVGYASQTFINNLYHADLVKRRMIFRSKEEAIAITNRMLKASGQPEIK